MVREATAASLTACSHPDGVTAIQHLKVSIVDASAEVKALGKPDWMKNCSHPKDHFSTHVFEKQSSSGEVRLTFEELVISIAVQSIAWKIRVTTLVNDSNNNENVIFRYVVQSSLETTTWVTRQA